MEGAGHNLVGRLSSMYEALGPSQATHATHTHIHTEEGRKEDDESNTQRMYFNL